MSRSVYRESETREFEERPRTYTTIKRYQMPDTSARSTLGADEETKEKITIRREKSAQPLLSTRDDHDYRFSDRGHNRGARDDIDIRITERERERSRVGGGRDEEDFRFSERISERDRAPQRETSYRVVERESDYDDRRSAVRGDFRSDYRSDFRVERERETVRAPSPPSQDRERVFRFERERDFSPPHSHRREDDYQVERYSKDTEYYQPAPIIIRESRPPPPQPIIIREERREPAPVIIREERREPQYEFIERKEVEEEKQIVKREEPPPPASQPRSPQPQQQQQQDEDYFYERRVREIDRAPRRREHSEERRSEIRPKDSASNYSSDDSYEYVKKTTYEDDSRDKHHKRHLAEGALAGAVGAGLLRHHRNSQGKPAGGRVRSTVGGAALGALGAEAVSRYRSRSRKRHSRSRSRSSSGSRDDKRDRRSRRGHRSRSRSRSRSQSRSKSMSRNQKLAAAAGVAAVGALAGYALKNRGNKNETIVVPERSPPRSRSRRRQGSEDSYMMDQMREDNKHRDPDHRNRRIAQAGLASAAAAGIWERVRSKSRGAKSRERSKSRIRTGVPIAAAGLGGAALAGLYEKNKASKEAKRDAMVEEEMGRGRRRRSRSRSRSVPAPYADDRRGVDDRGMIAYGDEPVGPGHDPRGYYSDEEPGTYQRRHRGGSSAGSSPDNRRRSRSRGKNLAEAGAAAGVAAVAAHEIGKRNERKRNDRDRQRQEDGMYDDHYDHSPYSPTPQGYLPQQPQAYPSSTYFPPPPTGENAYEPQQPYAQQPPQQSAAYAPYNPADYAAQPGVQPQYPYDQSRAAYGDSEANLGAPYANETYLGDNRYGGGAAAAEEPPREERRRGRDPPPPENVSAPSDPSDLANSTTKTKKKSNDNVNVVERETAQQDAVNDADEGVNASKTPERTRSTSRVRFDLDANKMHSPEKTRRKEERYSDSETSGDRKRRHRHSGRRSRHHHDRDGDDEEALMHDKYERPPSRSRSVRERDEDDGSDGTVEMPTRFDEHGNRKQDGDPLEALLGGLAHRFLGGGEDSEREGRTKRRHRH